MDDGKSVRGRVLDATASVPIEAVHGGSGCGDSFTAGPTAGGVGDCCSGARKAPPARAETAGCRTLGFLPLQECLITIDAAMGVALPSSVLAALWRRTTASVSCNRSIAPPPPPPCYSAHSVRWRPASGTRSLSQAWMAVRDGLSLPICRRRHHRHMWDNAPLPRPLTSL